MDDFGPLGLLKVALQGRLMLNGGRKYILAWHDGQTLVAWSTSVSMKAAR